MQAETVDVKSLFERDIRYLIPVFQRNYKWNESEHWAPLWVDLRNLATDLLEFGPGPDLSEHFLGAIVCEVQPAFGRDAQAVAVIDGQQRLTTVQLFLAAARRVCEQRGLDGDAQYLRGLLENSAHIVNARESHQYKIWPNVADRGSYVAAMRDSAGTSQPETATRFFEKQLSRWLDIGDDGRCRFRPTDCVATVSRSGSWTIGTLRLMGGSECSNRLRQPRTALDGSSPLSANHQRRHEAARVADYVQRRVDGGSAPVSPWPAIRGVLDLAA